MLLIPLDRPIITKKRFDIFCAKNPILTNIRILNIIYAHWIFCLKSGRPNVEKMERGRIYDSFNSEGQSVY